MALAQEIDLPGSLPSDSPPIVRAGEGIRGGTAELGFIGS
jgi:hypothetical protein